MKVFYTSDDAFALRPWGGRMCFLGTEESAGGRLLGVTAVLRMGQKLTHSTHVHDDCDEIILVLSGTGRQIFQNADGGDIAYELHPGDVLYIGKNRVHRTDNLSQTGDLELFIANYFYPGRAADPGVKGLIPAGSVAEELLPCGSRARVITPETSGSAACAGELVTLLPGGTLEGTATAAEEFAFCVSGEAVASAGGGEEEKPLPRCAQAFFFRGERYRLENRSDRPATLFFLRAEEAAG